MAIVCCPPGFELFGGESKHGCFNHFFKLVFSCLFLILFFISRYHDGVNSDAMISTSSIVSSSYVLIYGLATPNGKNYFFGVVQSASLFGFSMWAACISRTDKSDFNDTAYVILGAMLGSLQAFMIIVSLESSGSETLVKPIPAPVSYEVSKNDDTMLTSVEVGSKS